MLRFLRIRDFALLRELEIEFGPGLSLLTGETGSGKSILVDALGMVLGERASQEMVRSGCEQAVLEAAFVPSPCAALTRILEDAGIESCGDQLLIRREISATGRNRVFINNSLATLSLLKSVGEQLADIHGQQDHHSLLNLNSHLEFLDRFGGNRGQVDELRAIHRRLHENAVCLDSIVMDEQERLKRVDILQYQLDEIRRANPQPGESEELQSEKSLLTHREEIFSRANEVYSLLYESENSVLSQANRAARALEEVGRLDSNWTPFRESVSEAIYKLEDLAYFARDYSARIDFSPGRLDQIEQRLSELDRLARKYGHSVAEILQYADKCERELQELESNSERLLQLEEQLKLDLAQYLAKAEKLSEKRRRDARVLERQIRKELQALSMDRTDFQARFNPRENHGGTSRIPGFCRPDGMDRVEFMISPNRGEELRPLARIASGGELSRIVLALKTIGGGEDSDRTLVFDEVDAGIGGRVAEAVGRRLRDISTTNQVLCVTHLPQIAAFATSHYRVSKVTAGPRTETFLQHLSDSERVEEMARMVGGETITETARKHAREMLARSHVSARKK